jgi:hypothetical protein
VPGSSSGDPSSWVICERLGSSHALGQSRRRAHAVVEITELAGELVEAVTGQREQAGRRIDQRIELAEPGFDVLEPRVDPLQQLELVGRPHRSDFGPRDGRRVQ